MNTCRFALSVLLLSGSSLAMGGALDLNLSGDAVRLDFATPLSAGGLEADVSFLHHEEDGQPDADIAGLGLHLVDDAAQNVNPFRVGVGAKLFFMDTEVLDGGALGVGGFFRWTLPQYNRFALGGSVHFAPDVVSFGDAETFLAYTLRGEYEILRQANVYIGYRRVRAEFADVPGRVTLDSGIHFGLRITF